MGNHATGENGPDTGAHAVQVPATDFTAVQSSPEFRQLRRTHRSFVFPMTVAFLVWYFAYVLLADYAHGFMSIKLVGNINVGLALGLLQFVSTFAITAAYVRFANKKLDPQAEAIRHRIEAAAGGAREGENQ